MAPFFDLFCKKAIFLENRQPIQFDFSEDEYVYIRSWV
jgi:hypothetical protein